MFDLVVDLLKPAEVEKTLKHVKAAYKPVINVYMLIINDK